MGTHEVCMIHDCKNEPMNKTPVAICFSHLREIGSIWAAAIEVAFPSETRDDSAIRARSEANLHERRESHGVVYYVRIGDHIKIGTSVEVYSRMNALGVEPDALLATEPGSFPLETRRHREFSAERLSKRRELFNPSPRLLTHIDNLKQAQMRAAG